MGTRSRPCITTFHVAKLLSMKKTLNRCSWCGTDPDYVAYHDTVWGEPCRDDRTLFEFLTLEGAQAGLSWITILRKREGYRKAFLNWDVEAIASMDHPDVDRLVQDASIVRHRMKIESTISNARAVLALRNSRQSLSDFVWDTVDGEPRMNAWNSMSDVPSETSESQLLSRKLKASGFRFVGPTTVYAFMQATGMVNDHLTACFRHGELLISCGQRE